MSVCCLDFVSIRRRILSILLAHDECAFKFKAKKAQPMVVGLCLIFDELWMRFLFSNNS